MSTRYKIWDYAPLTVMSGMMDTPFGLDFKKGLNIRLHPKLTFVKGEIVNVKHYAEHDGTNVSNLIVDVAKTYDRDEDGVLTKKTETIRWTIAGEGVDENVDTFGPDEKIVEKFYNPTEAGIADMRRRKNVMDTMTARAKAFGVLSYVQTMFRALDNELNAWKNTGDDKLLEKVAAYDGQWLESPVAEGVTLRMAILDQLTL